MKRLLTYLLLIICVSTVNAQLDTAKIRKKIAGSYILIVPYSSELYINYEELYISKVSSKSVQEINHKFSTSLNESLKNELNKYCTAECMQNNYTYDSNDMLFQLYAKSSYFYDKAANIEKNYSIFRSEHSNLSDNGQNGIKGELNSAISDNARKFMNVKFSERAFLPSVSKLYKSDYILIITQFELKGDYSNTYAVESMTYDRRLKIHYSLFDKNGKFITGSFSHSDFSATVNSIDEIIEATIPFISKDIVSKIALGL